MTLTAEQKKQIAAGVLGVLALIAVSYSLFFSDDSGASNSSSPKQTAKPGIFQPVSTAKAPEPKQQTEVVLVSQPLELNGLWDSTSPMIGRNIFIYPPPPTPAPPKPTPTPTPVPPPPITLAGIQPSAVTARTADFALTVYGAKIPSDARVIINGAPYQTTVVSDSQLKLTVPAAAIANPGQMQVEVKSAADPANWYSNRVTLNVTPPPVPAYRYLGLVVKNGVSLAVIRDESESELKNVRKGQQIGSRWQVSNITPTEIEILDVTINIKHRIPFTGDGS
ncbi:MAG: IPT/TIG domain-containing protein [Acidobacteria bacterium]|nr:IPT/TIG domain-containing protein [Acidobacteriota bacterium]